MFILAFCNNFPPPYFAGTSSPLKTVGKANSEKDERKGTVQISLLWQEHRESYQIDLDFPRMIPSSASLFGECGDSFVCFALSTRQCRFVQRWAENLPHLPCMAAQSLCRSLLECGHGVKIPTPDIGGSHPFWQACNNSHIQDSATPVCTLSLLMITFRPCPSFMELKATVKVSLPPVFSSQYCT